MTNPLLAALLLFLPAPAFAGVTCTVTLAEPFLINGIVVVQADSYVGKSGRTIGFTAQRQAYSDAVYNCAFKNKRVPSRDGPSTGDGTSQLSSIMTRCELAFGGKPVSCQQEP